MITGSRSASFGLWAFLSLSGLESTNVTAPLNIRFAADVVMNVANVRVTSTYDHWSIISPCLLPAEILQNHSL
jgi:hypothetical protein